MWEEVAECSSAAGRGGRVREVVRERLERGDATPNLLCVLGDVTRDPEHYRRAWEMSGGRCGRAQRCLGLYHLRRNEVSPSPSSLSLSLLPALPPSPPSLPLPLSLSLLLYLLPLPLPLLPPCPSSLSLHRPLTPSLISSPLLSPVCAVVIISHCSLFPLAV